MSRGWWTIASFKGAPIRLHWSIALGALLWSRFSLKPAIWLSFVALILLHELGHALFVSKFRLGLSEIAVHGLGGYCRHQRAGSRFDEAVIAWGGVLAQLLLLGCVHVALLVLGPPANLPMAEAVYVLTEANLWLVCINLIPIEPLDGAKAWPLIPLLLERWRGRDRAPDPGRGPSRDEDELAGGERPANRPETPSERTDRIVRELIARTTRGKDR